MRSSSISNTLECVTPTCTLGKVSCNWAKFNVGDWPLATKENLVGGHEGAGVAVAVGTAVEDVKVGDHVGIKVILIRIVLIVVAERDLWSL